MCDLEVQTGGPWSLGLKSSILYGSTKQYLLANVSKMSQSTHIWRRGIAPAPIWPNNLPFGLSVSFIGGESREL